MAGYRSWKDLVERPAPAQAREPELVHEAVDHASCVNFLHLTSGYKVDVFVLREDAYDRCAFGRATQRSLAGDASGRQFRMATAEDIVLRKLLWFRAGDETSERQWKDVLDVVRVQAGALDRAYLSRWATHLDIDDLLARADAELNR